MIAYLFEADKYYWKEFNFHCFLDMDSRELDNLNQGFIKAKLRDENSNLLYHDFTLAGPWNNLNSRIKGIKEPILSYYPLVRDFNKSISSTITLDNRSYGFLKKDGRLNVPYKNGQLVGRLVVDITDIK